MTFEDPLAPALRDVLDQVLALGPARTAALDADSPLLGALPELDSMAIAVLFGAIEERFGLFIDDAAIDGDTLATFGTLCAFLCAQGAT